MQLYRMQPSDLGNVLGACDPAAICDDNFVRIGARFGLVLTPTNTDNIDSTNAPAAVQANFAVIAAALSVALIDVSVGPAPEVMVQANFESINAAW